MAEKLDQQSVVSLFEYIREINKLKQKRILNVKDYPWSITLADLPDDPENIAVFNVDSKDEEINEQEMDGEESKVLLSVRKPEFTSCPEPSDDLKPWLEEGWEDYHTVVVLKVKVDEHSNEQFEDSRERVEQYERWMEQRDAWVEKQNVLAKTHDLFTNLYRFYFELQNESETKEIIVANGMLCDADNPNIKHPVLTHRVRLTYDPDDNIVSIEDTNAETELYTILFQQLEGINYNVINERSNTLKQNEFHPLDPVEVPDFLKVLAHQLTSSSLFSEEGIPIDWQKNNKLLIYMEPCYIIRKKLDGTLKAIEQIIENVEEYGEIPASISEIVSGGKIEIPEEIKNQSIEEQLAAVGGESVDILLSKQANKEQLEIARRIENYNAVLVQGPPGTGKTHTIANLLGHFLAQGKSVLVTSHTTKALKVLKDKVAPGLRDLCVSILDDTNSDMEKSIDGITDSMSKTTSYEMKNEIDRIGGERREVIEQLAGTRRKIFNMLNQEYEGIVYRGESISPSKAAQFVVNNAQELSYIPGKVQKSDVMPLSFEQLTDLYRSNGGLTLEDEKELRNELPNPSELLEPSEFETTWNSLQMAQNDLVEIEKSTSWEVRTEQDERKIFVKGLNGELSFSYPQEEDVRRLKEFIGSFEPVKRWMLQAAVDGKKDGVYRQRWILLMEQIKKTCEYSERVVADQFGVKILYQNPSKALEQKEVYEELREIFEKKKKVSKLTLFFHKEYEEAISNVTVNEKEIQSVKDCELILHDIELKLSRKQCAAYWDELLSAHDVPKFEQLDSTNQENVAQKWIPLIVRYLDWYQADYQKLTELLKPIGIPQNTLFSLDSLDTDLAITEKILFGVEHIIPNMINICIVVGKIVEYSGKINENKRVLQAEKRSGSKLCESMLYAMEEGNVHGYLEAYGELKKMYDKYSLQKKREELLELLKPKAPQWADAIRNRQGVHGNNCVPSTIEDAWKWKQFSMRIDEITEQPFEEMQNESSRLSKEYREITAKYAEKCGWYHLLRKTESDIDMKQALIGWKQTVKRIGKGTGKNAPVYKAKARELMAKCQSAVPAWIMPIGKALESLNPKVNKFDIVIIDEASQSDISSLAILYMGRKLVIVGDDKQVSPMAVGLEIDKINALKQMYINGKISNAHLYDGKTSIYDIAATTFQPLMLREHFRCVPEIIGFSNMLSYENKIKPLRDESDSILVPAVVPYRVENGERVGKSKTNENEAKTIVALIQACMEQDEYEGKTFGVISLLGDEQVKVIQREIERKIPPKEIMGRNILCGNSANFQGDERDVVFLSVVDSGDGTGPLRKQTYGNDDATRKRYNVAASRARDQLWVVYSLDPANDLKDGDIRKELIDYALDPHALDKEHAKIEERADSPFEVSVATALVDRGYHIEQQWCVGSYRLDIVAVCGKKTVAIECDGERWHSGETKIREDMERQTILERLGWRFIRIRGSEYYRNPESTMKRVMEELTNFEIFPESVDVGEKEARSTELLERVKRGAAKFLEENQEYSRQEMDVAIAAALGDRV